MSKGHNPPPQEKLSSETIRTLITPPPPPTLDQIIKMVEAGIIDVNSKEIKKARKRLGL